MTREQYIENEYWEREREEDGRRMRTVTETNIKYDWRKSKKGEKWTKNETNEKKMTEERLRKDKCLKKDKERRKMDWCLNLGIQRERNMKLGIHRERERERCLNLGIQREWERNAWTETKRETHEHKKRERLAWTNKERDTPEPRQRERNLLICYTILLSKQKKYWVFMIQFRCSTKTLHT